MGASSDSKSTTSSTQNQYDQRKVQGAGAVEIGAFGSYSNDFISDTSRDYSNRSVNFDSSQRNLSTAINDSSQRNSSTDFSNRSTNDSRNQSTYSFTGTDGGAVQIAKLNSELLGSVASAQGDSVKAVSNFALGSINASARAATDLYATSSTAAGAAYGHAIDKSSELIDKLMGTAQATITGAQTVAKDAIGSYKPQGAQDSGTMKYALIAGAVVAALMVIKK